MTTLNDTTHTGINVVYTSTQTDQTNNTNDTTTDPQCQICGEEYPLARYKLKYKVCLACAAKQPQPIRTIVNLHKSNAVLITDMNDLKDLNPKYIRSAA